MTEITLSSKYQIVVPTKIRKALGLSGGSKILLQQLDENRIILSKKPDSYTESLWGLGKEVWRKFGGSQKYLQNERNSWGN
jgi:AbrB family looped-hinge helix DNA binding protein